MFAYIVGFCSGSPWGGIVIIPQGLPHKYTRPYAKIPFSAYLGPFVMGFAKVGGAQGSSLQGSSVNTDSYLIPRSSRVPLSKGPPGLMSSGVSGWSYARLSGRRTLLQQGAAQLPESLRNSPLDHRRRGV